MHKIVVITTIALIALVQAGCIAGASINPVWDWAYVVHNETDIPLSLLRDGEFIGTMRPTESTYGVYIPGYDDIDGIQLSLGNTDLQSDTVQVTSIHPGTSNRSLSLKQLHDFNQKRALDPSLYLGHVYVVRNGDRLLLLPDLSSNIRVLHQDPLDPGD